ncbi:SDR family NAD(P)-dependent oxidoreductase [Sphingobacterium corticis]|uniref:SDR family NAD(P)-dependent oxidoreductase n=1 Tax=Sphingobacterium corticis TaxID=1812823 RepID=A0ABW5NJF6_9SPHI
MRLLTEGAKVLAIDISSDGLEITRNMALEWLEDDKLTLVTLDVSDENKVTDTISSLLKEDDTLDVLVNAAGILRAAHFHETSLDLWNTLIKVNLTSTFLMTKTALPALLKSGKGVVVNFSSTAANFAHPYFAGYAASKGGIQALTHAIAAEYAHRGLRAVNIVPGGIQTGMTKQGGIAFPPDIDYKLFAKQEAAIPGGLGSVHAVAGAIAMLASDDGKFITGTELRIDGGAHM